MKQCLAILALAFAVLLASADQIVTRSADIIDCTVIKIDDHKIAYRKANETFDREINKGEVFKIKYTNGSEDIITTVQSAPDATPTAGAGNSNTKLVSTEPDWAQFPQSSKAYQIGDWYSENGIEGIVIWTTEDGMHGRIIHPQKFNNSKFKRPLAFFTGPKNISLGMNDLNNGYANWASLSKFMHDNPQYPMEMFPVAAHINSLGDGWYLPSIGELQYLHELRKRTVHYQGENTKFNGKTVTWAKVLNDVSKKHGGNKHDDYYKLSSTEEYSKGGANAIGQSLFGYPREPQFVLLRLEDTETEPVKPIVRNEGFIPYYALHLF